MKNFTRSIAALSALLVLSACQTSSITYRNAFENGTTPGQSETAKAEQADDNIDNYQFADLKPGQRPDITTNEAGLWMSMDRAEEDLATSGARVLDPALNAYVKNIACRVAGEYCNDIRIYVVRAPLFNAYMAPNGSMVVYTGLLLRSRNEAQVAAVIGHETAHYLRRHSAQRIKDAVDKTSALMFIQLATALAGVGGVGDLVAIATMGSMQAFSRDNEREADGYGLALMVRAGYDPNEAATIWQRVMREREADPNKGPGAGFLATHPPSEERNAELTNLSETVTNANELRTGEAAYQEVIKPLRAGFIRDELAKRQYSTTLALLDMLLEDGYAPAQLHYFRGELYRTRAAEGDRALALSAYRKAMSEDGTPSDLYRSYGRLLKREGKTAEAREAFTKYLELAPNAPDSDMIRALIEGIS